jgi:hypothetical protein
VGLAVALVVSRPTQEGVIALTRAMAKFAPTWPDDDLKTMAQAVADSASLSSPLHLPAQVHEMLRRPRLLGSELGEDREPTIAEMAARIHVPPEKLRIYRLIARTNAVPIESTIEISDPTGSSIREGKVR